MSLSSIVGDPVSVLLGISKSDNENTDEIVLELASRLDVKIERNDIEVSHRVGRGKYQSSVNNAPSGRQVDYCEI